MNRSGYSDEYENPGLWRGAVASAIRGRRGQGLLREMKAALEAMPTKTLIAESLIDAGGQVCALGAVGVARKLDMSKIDPEDYMAIAKVFGVSHALACEIMYLNDEAGNWDGKETPEKRFEKIYNWVCEHLEG